jgi:hypothetical protein
MWQQIYSCLKILLTIPKHLIEPITFLPEFVKDALVDSINLVPFLFIVFLFIEVLEQYFIKKKHLLVFFIRKIGPLFGSLFASIPQCGFSVISSTLYTRRILSRGTLLAVYLATSDEAIPVLVSDPSKIYLIFPIIFIKVVVAIFVGYLVDLFVPYKANAPEPIVTPQVSESGCCNHKLEPVYKTKEFWWHPIKHTFNIFVFILIVSLILGYLLSVVGTEENLARYCLINSPLQPILVSIIGLIPNCAISVMLTVLFIKKTISFGALISGLLSAGGLGMVILFKKNNDKKDTCIILGITLLVSSLVGLLFQYNVFHINKLFSVFGIQI